MKILKRILFTILGLLLVSAVSLVGVILYAEYSGKQFWAGSEEEIADAGFQDSESRLAYDENGNIAELPGGSLADSQEGSQKSSLALPEQTSAEAPDNSNTEDIDSSIAETPNTGSAGTDVSLPDTSNAGDTDNTASEAVSPADAASGSNDTAEQLYIMDMDAGLFHTESCSDVPDIAQDQRSDRTTSRDKILDAGYTPCPHCNP